MHDIAEMLPVLVMLALPLVAIVGGITHGIIKSVHRQRMAELAHTERIAAIEKGINPADLPPARTAESEYCFRSGVDALSPEANAYNVERRQLVKSRRFLMWGMITTGIGGAAFFGIMGDPSAEPGAPLAGIAIATVGVALMITARIVKPDPEDLRREKELRDRLLAKLIGDGPPRGE